MINAILKDELKSVNEREDEGFQINSLQTADWAMRKLQAIDEQDKETAATAQADLDKTIAWRDRKLTENQASREYFQGLLKDYLYRERKHDKKFKIDTPHGKVSTRKNAAGLNYDDVTVIKSLKKQGATDFIRVKEELDKKSLKKQGQIINGKFVLDDGEVIDGVTEKPATESVSFKF
ncbi:host-nuclease inhibitor Gam family protein [Lactiplantibacillus daowaiensis]|uniref:Host-nuclease inhibitor Gam family protein n=1 Tax=Lactiplantibacillus daowaiensis TaxID=2559918 RepID=A0ABW1RXY0_9LACO|nr:host-nuclease inhibitor Gam family protein [Lactiplantibacillus daowaiensis]